MRVVVDPWLKRVGVRKGARGGIDIDVGAKEGDSRPDVPSLSGSTGGTEHMRELVVVRREQRAAPNMPEDVVESRVSDGDASIEGCAAPDSGCQLVLGIASSLIHDDEGAGCSALQDRGRLDHLEHERRAVSVQVVAGADAREDLVHYADARALGGDEGAALCQNRKHGRLPQQSRLAALVWAGHDVQIRGGRHVSRVRGEGAAGGEQARLDGGVPARFNVQLGSAVS